MGAGESIRGAGRRIKRALSPNPYLDDNYYDDPDLEEPSKKMKLSFEPEISSDEED